jgi:allantoinase
LSEIGATISGSARSEIDATNLHIFPGLIDPHVHFNEPGRTEWEGFSTGSSALAAGGGTMFFDMPLNSSPPVLDGESFDLKLAAASKNSFTDFALWGGLTPKNLTKWRNLPSAASWGSRRSCATAGLRISLT